MRWRTKVFSSAAAPLTFILACLGAQDANALVVTGGGSTGVTGITVTGGYAPKNDPSYVYMFDIYLGDGYTVNANSAGMGDPSNASYVKISELAGIEAGAGSYFIAPTSGPAVGFPQWSLPSITNTVTVPPPGLGDPDYASDVTWNYTGYTFTNTTGSNVLLGELVITTNTNYPTPVDPVSTTTPTYSWQATLNGGLATGGGSLDILLVPEPSSIVMLLSGGAGLGLFMARRASRSRMVPSIGTAA